MNTPKASVYAGDLVIGTADITVLDQGMAVAGGVFVPTSHYVPKLHATELEGIDQPTERGSPLLSIVTADGTPLSCERIALVDWAETAGEQFGREVTAFGIDADRL